MTENNSHHSILELAVIASSQGLSVNKEFFENDTKIRQERAFLAMMENKEK